MGLGFWPAQDSIVQTRLTGVYKGQMLFIQNTYDSENKVFCIAEINLNNKSIGISSRSTAVKLDFEGIDLYAPVAIEIKHRSVCRPIVLNPDAIAFHSTFSFREVTVSDSTLSWKTVGDKSDGAYLIEKYQYGYWIELDTIEAKGRFEGADYAYYPTIEQGANKFRIKYLFPSGDHLYSREIDLHFYPEPVTFKPNNTKDFLYLSRTASYEIYDAGSKMVLSGQGLEIDVSNLPPGEYVVYFDGKDPGVFQKK